MTRNQQTKQHMPTGIRFKDVQESNDPSKSAQDRIKVEKAFQKHIEFDSKRDLLEKLANMKLSDLDTVLNKLAVENKIMVNNDGLLTWIYAADNEKLKKIWEEAVPL